MFGNGMPYGQRSNDHHERQLRSVFVGNIPYNSTEDEIKRLFETVGPVVSFKYVLDRETGKPKGFGFVEFGDQAMAESAVRNLTGHELNGRLLRIDSAANQAHRHGQGNQGGQGGEGGGGEGQSAPAPIIESPYGDAVEPEKAPEAISQAVASLPPEQMFELMKQMKSCIQNNANEARSMLLQNPQLAYALLQAQVVMRLVDPQVAIQMLHRGESASQQQAQRLSNIPGAPTVEPTPTARELTREEEQRQALITQVMSLTEDQVEQLPPEHKNSCRQLRQQLRAQGQMP